MSKQGKRSKQPAASSPPLEVLKQPASDVGISLDQLSAAFAEMVSSGDDPYGEKVDEQEADVEADDALQEADTDDACELSPRSILEAMLFVGSPTNQTLSSQQVASLMRGVRPAEIDTVARELNDQYRTLGCPYRIVSEGAGYRLALADEFHRIRDRFYGKVRQARLSQAAIEVLALVAYNGPLTSEQVNQMRGTSSGAILSQLVRRQLLALDRSDPEYRRGRYMTTARFLQLFGLESLDELPRSDDAITQG
jgi:segregation and condensation protein B